MVSQIPTSRDIAHFSPKIHAEREREQKKKESTLKGIMNYNRATKDEKNINK
jgi:hypothetical protein